MIVACPACQRKLKAPDALAGKRIQCPQCHGVFCLPVAQMLRAELLDEQLPDEELLTEELLFDRVVQGDPADDTTPSLPVSDWQAAAMTHEPLGPVPGVAGGRPCWYIETGAGLQGAFTFNQLLSAASMGWISRQTRLRYGHEGVPIAAGAIGGLFGAEADPKEPNHTPEPAPAIAVEATSPAAAEVQPDAPIELPAPSTPAEPIPARAAPSTPVPKASPAQKPGPTPPAPASRTASDPGTQVEKDGTPRSVDELAGLAPHEGPVGSLADLAEAAAAPFGSPRAVRPGADSATRATGRRRKKLLPWTLWAARLAAAVCGATLFLPWSQTAGSFCAQTTVGAIVILVALAAAVGGSFAARGRRKPLLGVAAVLSTVCLVAVGMLIVIQQRHIRSSTQREHATEKARESIPLEGAPAYGAWLGLLSSMTAAGGAILAAAQGRRGRSTRKRKATPAHDSDDEHAPSPPQTDPPVATGDAP